MPPTDPTPAHLPAPLPTPAALLRRTQGALGLLREVVQESSAEYWYAKGLTFCPRTVVTIQREYELVPDAVHAFKRCIELDPTHWRAAIRLSLALCIEGIFPAAADILLEAYKKTVSHEYEFYGELCFSETYPPDEDDNVWFYDYNEWTTIKLLPAVSR